MFQVRFRCAHAFSAIQNIACKCRSRTQEIWTRFRENSPCLYEVGGAVVLLLALHSHPRADCAVVQPGKTRAANCLNRQVHSPTVPNMADVSHALHTIARLGTDPSYG